MLGLPRRRHAGPDRFLHAKLVAFFLGAGFFFGGVATGRDWAVLLAVGILFVGVLLRFAPRGGSDAEESGEE